jgi:light-regulated signal transduction histidine kinase (bacteriophytochrome)
MVISPNIGIFIRYLLTARTGFCSFGRIVEDVKADLNELIQENEATIEIFPLPTLLVVPLQFHQLFSNLIINAIKYRRSGTKLVIKISATIVTVAGMPEEGPFKDDRYWKIEVSDNGIGFDQVYAERIFELFQRLHGKSEYEGTGIGLAICKKIVQNHNGFINATGQMDTGAVFNIYLPLNLK